MTLIGPKTLLTDQRWFPIYNDSGEEIPPFSIVELSDATIDKTAAGTGYKYKGYAKAKKPGSTNGDIIAVTGPVKIPVSGHGEATQDYPTWVAYDTGTPANGESWGRDPGQWGATKDASDFLVIGSPVDGDDRALVIRHPGDGFVLMQYSPGTNGSGYYDFLGNRDGGGVVDQSEECFPIAKLDSLYNPQEFGDPVLVVAKHYPSLVLPGAYFWAVKKYGVFLPVDPGQTRFCACSVAATINPTGMVSYVSPNAQIFSHPYFECEWGLPRVPIPEGSLCNVVWYGDESKFRVDAFDCPRTL